ALGTSRCMRAQDTIHCRSPPCGRCTCLATAGNPAYRAPARHPLRSYKRATVAPATRAPYSRRLGILAPQDARTSYTAGRPCRRCWPHETHSPPHRTTLRSLLLAAADLPGHCNHCGTATAVCAMAKCLRRVPYADPARAMAWLATAVLDTDAG